MEILFSTPTCLAEATFIGLDKIMLSAASFALAFLSFLILRKNVSTKSKIALIYSHIIFLFFPFVMLATNGTCGLFCMACHNNYQQLFAYAVPATFAVSVVSGIFVMPRLFVISSKRELKNKRIIAFIRRYSGALGIGQPRLYVIDKARPTAFSFRSLGSSIFLSVGVFDILKKKEIEAVLLHEMAHLRQRSSVLKFSSLVMKIFSPFALITGFQSVGKEEDDADAFAIKVQKTDRYLNSAKRKFEEFGH